MCYEVASWWYCGTCLRKYIVSFGVCLEAHLGCMIHVGWGISVEVHYWCISWTYWRMVMLIGWDISWVLWHMFEVHTLWMNGILFEVYGWWYGAWLEAYVVDLGRWFGEVLHCVYPMVYGVWHDWVIWYMVEIHCWYMVWYMCWCTWLIHGMVQDWYLVWCWCTWLVVEAYDIGCGAWLMHNLV